MIRLKAQRRVHISDGLAALAAAALMLATLAGVLGRPAAEADATARHAGNPPQAVEQAAEADRATDRRLKIGPLLFRHG